MIKNRAIAAWLFAVSSLVVLCALHGGWIRMARSGVPVAEWTPSVALLPPTTDAEWQQAAEAYRRAGAAESERAGLSLAAYRQRYWATYTHRLLARLTALAFVLPLLLFVARGAILRPHLPRFALPALALIGQELLGAHLATTAATAAGTSGPLLAALHPACGSLLLAVCFWMGLGYAIGQPRPEQPRVKAPVRRWSVAVLTAVSVQALGGMLAARLSAGTVTDSFPLMTGRVIPDGLLELSPWLTNFTANAVTVHFTHRWFGFVVLGLAATLNRCAKLELLPPYLGGGAAALLHGVSLQMVVGIAMVLLGTPPALALVHQAVGLAVMGAALFTCHRAFRS